MGVGSWYDGDLWTEGDFVLLAERERGMLFVLLWRWLMCVLLSLLAVLALPSEYLDLSYDMLMAFF